jgi:DNA-binding NarL/FixJ family response regulator
MPTFVSSAAAGDLAGISGEGEGDYRLTLRAVRSPEGADLPPGDAAVSPALILSTRYADATGAPGWRNVPAPPATQSMSASEPITLVVAHFEDLFARGLRAVTDGETTLEVLAGDVTPDRLDVVLRAHRPRAAILNVDAFTKLAQVRELSRQHPDTRLVLIATQPTMATCAQLLAFGASACLGRDAQARDLLTAIHLASRGLQLTPSHTGEPGALPVVGSQLLTQREAEILPMLQQGSSNAQIAWTLQVGVETIRTHARNIYRKLGVASRRELATLPLRAPPTDLHDATPRAPGAWATPGPETQRRPAS